MIKSSIIENIREQYIDEYLESAKKIDYTELKDKNLVKVFYKDLPKTEVEGYPIASDYVAPDGKVYSVTEFDALPAEKRVGCELRYYYLPCMHELYIGTTGSGKTTGCVEPQLRAISSQKNKPHLFLTDPKGELFNRNAQHIKDQGYELFVLNFKDFFRSDKWNPLVELYDTRMKIANLGKDCKMRSGKVKKGLNLIGEPRLFRNSYIEYNGCAFPNGEYLDNYVHFQRDYMEAEVSSLLNQMVSMIVRDQGGKDKNWESGAQILLKGVIHCMLEEAEDPESGFTRDMMNFRMIQLYYQVIKRALAPDKSSVYDVPFLKKRSSLAKQFLAATFDTAPGTKQSYCTVFESATKEWFQGHIYSLTTGNTIDLENLGDKPFAIFLITRDYQKDDFLIAGLFIDWVYRMMVKRADNFTATRPVHFLLDEFGNIPEIKDLDNKIATSRSRNIWFHLFVQSYKQIDVIYSHDKSVIIRDNCNAQIFLGAQNVESKEIFSKECGKHYIPSLASRLSPSVNNIEISALIPISDLDLIPPGQMYIKRLYMPVITSQFIRSYVCANQGTYKYFINPTGFTTCTPISIEPFSSPRFTFSGLDDYVEMIQKDKKTKPERK